jgi:osmotically-inducible protein OsmY
VDAASVRARLLAAALLLQAGALAAGSVLAINLPEDANIPTTAADDSDDLRVTAQIRSALLADGSLSDLAHKVRIATNQQAVILRGAVKAGEKDQIESLAGQFAGTRQVIDQLTVDAP